MAWIGGAIAASVAATAAATNQKDGKRLGQRKESKIALVISIFLIMIGSLVPLGIIVISYYSGDSSLIFIIGIAFMMIFGSLILVFTVMETAYEDEKDPDLSKRGYRGILKRDMISDRNLEEKSYWGNPISAHSSKNYCSQCGSQVEFEDQFCSTCGRRI